VVVRASVAMANLIISGDHSLLPKYFQLIQNGTIRPQAAIEKLPQVLGAVGRYETQTNELLLSTLRRVSETEYDRQLVAFAIE
jgi:hypothetical protein